MYAVCSMCAFVLRAHRDLITYWAFSNGDMRTFVDGMLYECMYPMTRHTSFMHVVQP
jgi:hypothetical protein